MTDKDIIHGSYKNGTYVAFIYVYINVILWGIYKMCNGATLIAIYSYLLNYSANKLLQFKNQVQMELVYKYSLLQSMHEGIRGLKRLFKGANVL